MLHHYELVTETGVILGIREFAVSDWKPGDLITLGKDQQVTVIASMDGNKLIVTAP